MAYYPDLSNTRYPLGQILPHWRNIGFLSAAEPYQQGETSREFQERLLALCERATIHHMGTHTCEFCKNAKGGSLIRVKSGGLVYEAPILVYHYVLAHGYKPPNEFVAAVLATKPSPA